MKNKSYKLKIPRGVSIRGLAAFLKIFKRKPKIINLSGEELHKKAVYLSNHTGAHGPLIYEMYFPEKLTPWGTHEMCGNFRERWNYLYHVFYQQKKHWNKAKSFVVATLFAPISKLLYKGVGLIGTYQDARFIGTLKNSMRVLDQNHPLIIFPEDSSLGYMDPPVSFHMGFVQLAKAYHRKHNEDLPIYICYCSAKKNLILVGKPIFANQLIAQGKTDKEIADYALELSTQMYYDYVEKDVHFDPSQIIFK